MATGVRSGIPSAGLFAGPAAWLVNTELNYALVPWICAHKVQFVPAVALGAALISLLGAFLSWRAWATASPQPAPDRSGAGRPHRFLAAMGISIALLFTLVILVQGSAGLLLHGCER
jgi:hypothetical protein